MGNKCGEGNAHGYLRNAYQRQGDFQTAIDYHIRRPRIAKEVGDINEEPSASEDPSNANKSLGEFTTAIEYHKHHLKIAKEEQGKVGEERGVLETWHRVSRAEGFPNSH